MTDSTNGSASKPSIFGKMFSIIKNVTEMALDTQPGNDSDDGLSDTDNNGADEDSDNDEPVTLDFLTKYDAGSSVRNNLTADAAAASMNIASQTADLLDLHTPTEDLLDPELLALDPNISELLLADDDLCGTDLTPKDNTTELSSASSTSDIPTGEGSSEQATPCSEEGKTAASATRGFASSGIAGTFQTRTGPNYKTNKQKAPSAPALLELMSVDFVRTPCRVPDVGRFLNIPAEWSAHIDTQHPGIPPLFIVQAQIPDKWPTTVFVETTDGPCYSFILVYRITQEAALAMQDLPSASPTVQLFAQYCLENYQNNGNFDPSAVATDSATSNGNANGASGTTSEKNVEFEVKGDHWVARSKVFVRCDNINELKLPKFLHAYNAKPALIRESGTLIRGNGYLELDINIKKFGLLANKTLPVLLARLHLMQLSIAICIESREEDEMPEGILGCVGVHNLSASAKDVPMWFVKRKC